MQRTSDICCIVESSSIVVALFCLDSYAEVNLSLLLLLLLVSFLLDICTMYEWNLRQHEAHPYILTNRAMSLFIPNAGTISYNYSRGRLPVYCIVLSRTYNYTGLKVMRTAWKSHVKHYIPARNLPRTTPKIPIQWFGIFPAIFVAERSYSFSWALWLGSRPMSRWLGGVGLRLFCTSLLYVFGVWHSFSLVPALSVQNTSHKSQNSGDFYLAISYIEVSILHSHNSRSYHQPVERNLQ